MNELHRMPVLYTASSTTDEPFYATSSECQTKWNTIRHEHGAPGMRSSLDSEQVLDGLVRVLLDQVQHTLAKCQWRTGELRTRPISYLWHDRSIVRAPHVSEGHRGRLVLVEPELGRVDEGDLFKGGYRNVHIVSLSIETIFFACDP